MLADRLHGGRFRLEWRDCVCRLKASNMPAFNMSLIYSFLVGLLPTLSTLFTSRHDAENKRDAPCPPGRLECRHGIRRNACNAHGESK